MGTKVQDEFASVLEYGSVNPPDWNSGTSGVFGSLLAMLSFAAARFLDILNTTHQVEDLLRGVNPAHPLPSPGAPELIRPVEYIRDNAVDLDLTMSVVAANRMIEEINGACTVGRLIELFRDLNRRIGDELNSRIIFMIPQDRAQHYNAAQPLGGSGIVGKLPATIDDAIEAGNCFALGRYTACVFHLMRVMEVCVKALGAKLGVTSADEQTWGLILSNVRSAVGKRYPDPHDPDRKAYESMLSHLESLKIAWRNPTMHPKNVYTEEQAENILVAVRIFTDDLASLL